MKGQWTGVYQGTVDGKLMVNIDEVEGHFEGVAYMLPHEANFPASMAYLETENKHTEHEIVARLYPINPTTYLACEWEDIQNHYGEDVSHSKTANVTIRKIDNELHIEAVSDIGGTLSSVLTKPLETDGSKIDGERMTWKQFKGELSRMTKPKCLFRGQERPWRLATSFHRQGRYRISEFTSKDVKQLHQKLSAITSHYFDLLVPDQNGSFFNLLQHHGYPTPLLDWSYSPYVAAFFAFRRVCKGDRGKNDVRIYLFDNEAWEKTHLPIKNLDPPFPHLSAMDFIAIDNPRLVPQQAVTTVTNLDDVEAYILDREAINRTQYLRAIDISTKYRDEAMNDLRFMGITAGSMFPSIDGVCEELKERNF